MVSTAKRRRFQAPITSFFNRESSSSGIDSNPQQAQLHEERFSSPTLPPEIQSSLLTVGMRVRKSVPEGYKTHKILHSSPLHGQPGQLTELGVQDFNYAPHSIPSSTTHWAYAELAPFCGLHKIGGMAVQPMPAARFDPLRYASNGGMAEPAEDCLSWSIPSSQESMDSHAELTSSNKRAFIADEDEDEDDEDDPVNCCLSPPRLSYPFSHTRMPDLNTLLPSPAAQTSRNGSMATPRAFAVPRSRFCGSEDKKPAPDGQENLDLISKASNTPTGAPTAVVHEVDFEDADFLKARPDVDFDDSMDSC